MSRNLLRIAVGLAVFGLSLPVPADQHETVAPAWDQERVAALAGQLKEAAEGLSRELARRSDQSQVASGQARAMMEFKDEVRVARNESRYLARALADGKSRDETRSAYRRLTTLVRDLRDTGRRLFLQQPALDHIAKANEALDGLAPYYPDVKPG